MFPFTKLCGVSMLASKIITFLEPVDLDVVEVTLLSEEEYRANKNIIPLINKWWWLCSPGGGMYYAVFVYGDGSLSANFVNTNNGCVRPVLRIRNFRSCNLLIENKFELAGYTWTVLSDDLALCDKEIGRTCFREDIDAEDANVYKKSDIKKYLKKWAAEAGIL